MIWKYTFTAYNLPHDELWYKIIYFLCTPNVTLAGACGHWKAKPWGGLIGYDMIFIFIHGSKDRHVGSSVLL